MSELLTVHDVARLCQLHEVTVRRHISEGRLLSVRVGKGVRVRKEDLDAYIEPQDHSQAHHAGRQGRPFTKDDAFWKIVGAFDDPGGAWVSGDIHRAVAEAIDRRQ